jgi:hypothetical protein
MKGWVTSNYKKESICLFGRIKFNDFQTVTSSKKIKVTLLINFSFFNGMNLVLICIKHFSKIEKN